MTTEANRSASDLEIRYEGSAPSFGGWDAADFIIVRPHQHSLECNLQLSQDARALFGAKTGGVDEEGAQALLRALAARLYARFAAEGEIPAIFMVRASEIDAGDVDAILEEAGLA